MDLCGLIKEQNLHRHSIKLLQNQRCLVTLTFLEGDSGVECFVKVRCKAVTLGFLKQGSVQRASLNITSCIFYIINNKMKKSNLMWYMGNESFGDMLLLESNQPCC